MLLNYVVQHTDKKGRIFILNIRPFNSISKLKNHHFIETLWHIGVRMNENS